MTQACRKGKKVADEQAEDLRTMFVSDAAECLEHLETELLSLEKTPDDRKILDSVFRRMHTLKGNAAVVQYGEVEWFAHVAESVLMRLREQALLADTELISVLLACCDHLRFLIYQIDCIGGHSPEFAEVDRARLIGLLVGYLSDEDEVSELQQSAPSHGYQNHIWLLSLKFEHDVFLRGLDPVDFIRHAESIGKIISVRPCLDAFPDPATFNPESCYLAFEVEVETAVDRQRIEDIFSFMGDSCHITLTPPEDHVSRYVKRIESFAEELQTGEMLMRAGAITPTELGRGLRMQRDCEPERRLLGDILIEEGIVNPEVIQAALLRQDEIKISTRSESHQLRISVTEIDALTEMLNSVLQLVQGMTLRGLAVPLAEVVSIRNIVEKAKFRVEKMRTMHFSEYFRQLQRTTRDVSLELGKQVDLLLSGGEVALDRSVAVLIVDMLIHLLRNAIDHGIERPEQRTAIGKPQQGTISITLRENEEFLYVVVSDDGMGIDPEGIRDAAVSAGVLQAGDSPDPQALFAMMFEPGLSTADRVSHYSGRGVGLDIVRETASVLGGEIFLTSRLGHGTQFEIRLPLAQIARSASGRGNTNHSAAA